MISIISGEDNFRARLKLSQTIKEHVGKGGLFSFDFNNFGLESPTLDDVLSAIKSNSLFDNQKIVVIKDFFSKIGEPESKKLVEAIKEYGVQDNKDLTMVFYESSSKIKNPAFSRLIKNTNQHDEFNRLEGASLFNFVRELEKRFNLVLDNEAEQALITSFGSDTEAIYNYLNKLALYKTGNIKLGDLEETTKLTFDSKIFDLLDCVAQKNIKKSLRLLGKEINDGTDPVTIFNMVTYQIRNLLSVKSLGQGQTKYNWKNSGLNYYVFKKADALARRFSIEELKNIYRQLSIYDFKIKTGQISPYLALEIIVSNIK